MQSRLDRQSDYKNGLKRTARNRNTINPHATPLVDWRGDIHSPGASSKVNTGTPWGTNLIHNAECIIHNCRPVDGFWGIRLNE